MNDLRSPEKKFRPELEGVRAVAALLVAIYHIWLGSVSGGVDVFFIVSGYLITTSLLSRMMREGKINIGEYLLGLGRRLFPIAFTVLLVTTAASIFILPQVRWVQTIPEIFSSVFYYQNWQLANSAVDYLAQNNAASPFQHFWALSIQGQFYITWPLIIIGVYFIARKVLKTPVRKTLLAILTLLFTASLTYSIYITAENQPWAYFDTFARAWEFSLGGMLALLIPYLKFKPSISFFLGWLGLAIITLTGILLPVSTVFPGYAALLPTGGVILVIIAAETGSKFGVEKLLGSKPFMYFGSISYGFYLWHWPLLVFYYAYFGRETVTNTAGFMILLSTFMLSILSIRLLEAPVRKINIKQSKGRLSAILAAFMLPVIIAGLSWSLYVNYSQAGMAEELPAEDYPGARMISDNVPANPDLAPLPEAVNAKGDLASFYYDEGCYTARDDDAVSKCSYGETEDPEYIVALVGGSHSGHWFPPLEKIAQNLNLQLDVYNKDACRFSQDDFDGFLSESCMEWNAQVMKPLLEDPPDMLITTANINKESTIPQGYIERWKQFEGVSKVFAIRDNPRMVEDPPLCIEETPEKCSITRAEALSDTLPWENTEDIPNNVVFADLSDYFCDDEECSPVIGNVLVYRDHHHLTATYAETMAPALEVHIEKALEQLDD
ncbi:acyltransferase family protein [Jeotgalibacillus sp. ET6]|uniref:acyltransferase family protein n=1 Tax=Jeotgalibacillus sp. ET6 TaxID=3037260 RepID=UPI0024189633|nr:acyltransferase family protein [Jeotgalibacillus sp. ET6]MDG5473668.1 acyltransferase family protein [Jeotgalibacillus sp. ET6]